jgi:hypothetical protein
MGAIDLEERPDSRREMRQYVIAGASTGEGGEDPESFSPPDEEVLTELRH